MFDILSLLSSSVFVTFLVAAYLGLVLGSFATAIIYRTRHNQSWIWNNKSNNGNKGRSFCPSCHHVLGLRDLIPVFSYLWQKGRCRYCTVRISSSYLLTELLSLLICFIIVFFLGLTIQALLLMFLSPFLLSQIILGVKYKIISPLLLGLIVCGAGAYFILF